MARGGARPNTGGARPGAGRKRKLGAVEIDALKDRKPEAAIRAAARSKGKAEAIQIGEALGWAPDEVAEAIRPGSGAKALSDSGDQEWPDSRPAPTIEELDELARKTLRQIMEKSPQDGPRVVAARHSMAVAAEARAAETGGTGKKMQRKAAAERTVSEGGKFAPRPPPQTRTLQ